MTTNSGGAYINSGAEVWVFSEAKCRLAGEPKRAACRRQAAALITHDKGAVVAAAEDA